MITRDGHPYLGMSLTGMAIFQLPLVALAIYYAYRISRLIGSFWAWSLLSLSFVLTLGRNLLSLSLLIPLSLSEHQMEALFNSTGPAVICYAVLEHDYLDLAYGSYVRSLSDIQAEGRSSGGRDKVASSVESVLKLGSSRAEHGRGLRCHPPIHEPSDDSEPNVSTSSRKKPSGSLLHKERDNTPFRRCARPKSR
jgi:hypothetical protein